MRTIVAALLLCLSGSALAEHCTASVYGTKDRDQNGTRTASGIPLNDSLESIARPDRKWLKKWAVITNLENGQTRRFLTTDLGPFVHGRCVDFSIAAARSIGCNGLCRVEVSE